MARPCKRVPRLSLISQVLLQLSRHHGFGDYPFPVRSERENLPLQYRKTTGDS